MANIHNDFKPTFKYYADYYRFLELNDEKVYNHIIELTKKKIDNPNSSDFVNMTMKFYYKQVKIKLTKDKKYILALFKQHYLENDIPKSLNNINLIIVKSNYELTFEDGILILNTYPSLKDYLHSNNQNIYILNKLNEILELVEEEEKLLDFKEDDLVVGTDILGTYLNEIKSIPVLSWEEQKELAYKILEGDEEAKEKMINSNLRLVIFVARRYLGRGLEFTDLIGAGNEGLLKAVKYFDPNLGCRFTTYAFWWIRQSITRTIANEARTIRVPVHYGEEIKRFRAKVGKLEKNLGREVTYKDIVKYTHYSEAEIQSFLIHSGSMASLNVQIGDESDGNELQEFIPDETNIENTVLDQEFYNGAIKLMQKILSDRYLMVIILRLGINGNPPRTLEEIGSIIGVTRERIRQIQKTAGEKLKKNAAFISYIQNRERVNIKNNSLKGLSELFKGYRNQLEEVVKLLPPKDQELLKKRYNNDLSLILNYDMSINELTYIYEVIYPKIKKMLSENHFYSLEEAFGTDYLNMVIATSLNKEEQNILKNRKVVSPELEAKLVKGIIANLGSRNLNSFLKSYDPKVIKLIIRVMFPDKLEELNAFFNNNLKNREEYIDSVVDTIIKIKNILNKKITIYTLIPNTRKILIDKTINNLNPKQQEILKSAFGSTYQGEIWLTDEDNIVKVLKEIKILTSNKVGNVNIRYFFPEYSSNKIREIGMKVLSKEEYNLLKYYFGPKLEEGLNPYLYDSELRKVLEHLHKSLEYKVITLEDYLGTPNKEVLNILNSKEKELLIKALGQDYLTNPVNNFLYPEERRMFAALIKKLRENIGLESLMTYLNLGEEYHTAVYETLLNLSDADSELLVNYFGKNPFNISKKNIIIKEGSSIAILLQKIQEQTIYLNTIIKKDEGLSSFYRYLNIARIFRVKVKKAVEKLSSNDLETIYQVFGYNFLENATLRIYDDDKRKKLNLVKDKILKYIAATDVKKTNKSRYLGFYEYFKLNQEDRFYIEIALDSYKDFQLEMIKKKYGDYFLDDTSHKSSLGQGEYYNLKIIKNTLADRVEYLKNQAQKNQNYFFDTYLKIDKEKYCDIVKNNIASLTIDDKNLLITCFGKHYLDYPLNLANNSQRIKLEKLKHYILINISKQEEVKPVVLVKNHPIKKVKPSIVIKPPKKETPKENIFFKYLGISHDDKNYLEEALKFLTPLEHSYLEKRFGKDVINNPIYNKVEPNVSSKISVIKNKILKNIDLLKNGKTPNTRRKRKSTGNVFFTYLGLDYTKDLTKVEEAIKYLSPADQKVLISRFGKDYIHHPSNNEVKGEDLRTTIGPIKRKIIAYINFKPQEFYTYLGLTKEDKPYIVEAIKTITPKQLKILKKKYGENFIDKVEKPKVLDKNEIQILFYVKNSLVKKVKTLKANGLETNSFFNALGLVYEKDKAIVVSLLKISKEEYITLFKETFGEDFINNPLESNATLSPELTNALQDLKAKVNYLKSGKFKIESLSEYLGIKENQIYLPEVMQDLSENNIKTLKKIWGEDFLTNSIRKTLSKEEAKTIYSIKKRILDKIEVLKKRELDKDLIKVVNISYAVSDELKNNVLFAKWFNYLKNYLVVSDALILCLYLGFYGKKLTPKELSIIFGTSEKVMLLKLKEIINSLKQYQDKDIDKLLLTITN